MALVLHLRCDGDPICDAHFSCFVSFSFLIALCNLQLHMAIICMLVGWDALEITAGELVECFWNVTCCFVCSST